MHVLIFRISLCLLVFVNVGVLGLAPEARQWSIAGIPACGLECLLPSIPATGCSLTDTECQCQSELLATSLLQCMLANCTMQESLDSSKVQGDLCNYSHESKKDQVYLYTSIVFSIAVLFVSLQVAGKLISKRTALGDWIIVFAMLLTAVPCGCVIYMTGDGFGNHLWNLELGQLLRCLRMFYIAWSTYVIILGLIKVSLVMFYLEIFTSKKFRIAAWATLGYIILSSIIIYFLTIFSCIPVESFWNKDLDGKCMNINALAYAYSASAIAQNVILLILPLVAIRNLRMRRRRKIAVGFMFSIGTFGVIATILRLRSLLVFKISFDPTWNYVPVALWTELELAAGFICFSLPGIRLLVALLIPKRLLVRMMGHERETSAPTTVSEENQHSRQRRCASWMHIPTFKNKRSVSGTGSKCKSFGSRLWPSSALKSQAQSQHVPIDSVTDRMTPNWPSRVSTGWPLRSSRSTWWDQPPQENQPKLPLEMSPARPPAASLQATKAKGRQNCAGCGSQWENVTALPKIGCLPDNSYSQLDVTRDFRGLDRQWTHESEMDRVNVQ